MTTFKVGDIAVGQGFVHDTDRNGVDCEIVAPLRLCFARHPTGRVTIAEMYRVQWADGDTALVTPPRLRPKKPPTREIDTVVSWSDCLWQPMKEMTC